MVIRKIIMYHVCFVDTENNEIVAVKIFDRFSKAENYLEQQNAIPIMGDGDYYNIDGKVYFISADSIEEIEGVKGMKILEIKENKIIFDNGKELTYDHEQDCCEHNYADFSQLEVEVMKHNFYEPLDFEAVEGSGFRFGNKNKRMFFVPCYSEQNGYYTRDLDIYYGGEKVLETEAEWKEW